MLEFINRRIERWATSKYSGRIIEKYGATELARLWEQGEDVSTGGLIGNSALKVNVVYASIKVLAETLATMNLILYERKPLDERERALKHPLYWILKQQPNRWQTSYEYFEMLMVHLCLRGNAISFIQRDAKKNITSLIPMNPNNVCVQKVDDFQFIYYWNSQLQGRVGLTQDQVFHVRNLTVDGIWGLSPIGLAALSINTAHSAEVYEGSIYKSGGSKRIALEHPGSLTEAAQKRLRESFDKAYAGTTKTAVLEEGLTAKEIGISPKDAQFIEGRRFAIADIARIFRVPPHMVGDLTRSTFNNITDQTLSLVKYTMSPWIKRFEQAITRDLISQKNRFFAEFLVDTLLRGDITSRYTSYHIGISDGWLNRNEVRRMENMNRGPDELDEYLVPLNMVNAEDANTVDDENNEPEPAEEQPEKNYTPLINDIAERIAASEYKDISKRIKYGFNNGEYESWINKYFVTHKEYIATIINPFLRSIPKVGIQEVVDVNSWIFNYGIKEWQANEPSVLIKEWPRSRRIFIQKALSYYTTDNPYKRLKMNLTGQAVASRIDISDKAESGDKLQE